MEVLIGNSTYKISCKKEEQERLEYLAELLNRRIAKIAKKLGDIDDKTMMAMLSLILEDELERKTSGIFSDDEDEENSKLNDQDLYEAVSENMENVAEYVEKLAEKIKNY